MNGNGAQPGGTRYALAPGTTIEHAFALLDALPREARLAIYEAPIPFSPVDAAAVMRNRGWTGAELAAFIRLKSREIMEKQEREIEAAMWRRDARLVV